MNELPDKALSPHEVLMDAKSVGSADTIEEERMVQWSLIQKDWARMMCEIIFPGLSSEEREAEEINWLIDDAHSDWFRTVFRMDVTKQGLISMYKEDPEMVLQQITHVWNASKH